MTAPQDQTETPAGDAADPAPVITVGTRLREARIARDETIRDVADRLRIRATLLQALEQDDHASLPGGIYSIGFVRAYAGHLGLDVEALEHQWRDEAQNLTRRAEYRFPTPTLERRLPGLGSVLGGLAILAISVGAVFWARTWYGNPSIEAGITVPPLSPELRALLPGVDTSTDPAPLPGDPGQPESQLRQPLDEAGLPVTTPDVTALSDEAAPEPAAAPGTAENRMQAELESQINPDAAPPGGQSFGADPADSVLSLSATRDVWLLIRDRADGAILLTRVLHPGDRYFAPDSPGLTLSTGDAGALEVGIKGKAPFTLGADGKIIDGAALQPRVLEQLAGKLPLDRY